MISWEDAMVINVSVNFACVGHCLSTLYTVITKEHETVLKGESESCPELQQPLKFTNIYLAK